MAATGIRRDAALNRLAAYHKGRRSADSLLVPKAACGIAPHENWGDLGLGPRKRIEDIPGETELERRVYRRDRAREEIEPEPYGCGRPGRRPTKDKPLVLEIVERAGIKEDAAWMRLRKHREGLLSRAELFAPPHPGARRPKQQQHIKKEDNMSKKLDGKTEKAAAAWNALMEKAGDVGFSKLADADPMALADAYIKEVNEVMTERNRLKAELTKTQEELGRARANIAGLEEELKKKSVPVEPEVVTDEETAKDVALLRWARWQLEAGKIGLYIEVRELEEAPQPVPHDADAEVAA